MSKRKMQHVEPRYLFDANFRALADTVRDLARTDLLSRQAIMDAVALGFWLDDQDSQAPGSGSASAEAVPGDSVADHHAGDAASPSAPPASSPHPSQEPLSYDAAGLMRLHRPAANACPVCHRPLPLCEC